jgi:hypothetical protein
VRTIALPDTAVPAARGEGLRVDFVAHAGQRTPRLFELRLVEQDPAHR